MSQSIKRIGIVTGGGDCPGINAVIRAVAKTAIYQHGLQVLGIEDGFLGLLENRMIELSSERVSGILTRGGTILGTNNRCNPSRHYVGNDEDGNPRFEDLTDHCVKVVKRNELDALIVIGGDGTMECAAPLVEKGINCIGVPKTIDNDVGDSEFKLIDHTPGYGSVAKYWMSMVAAANEENRGASPSDPVLIMQTMGRKIGFIPAAARLADPDRELPLLIFLAESGLSLDDVADRINDTLKEHGRAVVVVSEGFPIPPDALGASRDSFGHVQFGASKTTVASVLVNYLNEKGLPVRGAARGQTCGTDQRSSIYLASSVDLEEAYKVGEKAVLLAQAGVTGNGRMSTILRLPGPIYGVEYSDVALEDVANSERTFPESWISADRTDVTDEFVRYARPLIGEDWVSVPLVDGRPRFTRLKRIFAAKKCKPYEPVSYRS